MLSSLLICLKEQINQKRKREKEPMVLLKNQRVPEGEKF